MYILTLNKKKGNISLMKSCPKHWEDFFMKILFNELKKYKISLFLILIFTYVSTVFELTIPLLLANAINIGIIENYGLTYVKNIVLMMVSFIVISIILNIVISYLTNKISIYSATNIKNNLFEKVISLKESEKSKISTSSLLTRTNQDVEQIRNFITSFLGIIFKAPILFLSCITILKTLNKNFSTLLVISIIILVIYLTIIILKLFPLSRKIQTSLDKLNLLIKEKLTGFKIIKTYNKLEYQDTKFKKVNNEYLTTTKKVIKLSSLIMPILNLLINSLTIIILFLSINLVKNNYLEIGTIVATIQYILQILLSIIMLSMIILLIPKTQVSLSRIKEVMNSTSYEDNQELITLNVDKITFNNISFSYSNTPTLNNINLTINKNDKIGIIGPTGSGKSTLLKLLLKDNHINEGTIEIDNYKIEELTRRNILNNITYSPQTPTILTGTILENIAFANPQITSEELYKILYTCNLMNFVNEKKENLNYKIEENGTNLSGGQKQRLCLARSLAKKSNTIILDEPFYSLDYKNTSEILTKLTNYYNDKTIVIASQRISCIKNLNKIIVMDKGKIIAIDSHENLLKNCSLYKEMYDSQKEELEYDI